MPTEHADRDLLAGTRVVDLAGEPAAMAGRLLADLGAEVVLPEPPAAIRSAACPTGGPRGARASSRSWSSGPDDPALLELLAERRHRDRHPGLPRRAGRSTRRSRPTRSG